jgi:hypothetical protein
VYEGLAAMGWLAPWYVVEGSSTLDYDALAGELVTD